MTLSMVSRAPILRPSYSASGGAALTDGGNATITGSGFGTNVVTQDFFGGFNNLIEQAANNTLFTSIGYTNWNTYSDNTARVSTTQALTRTKSLGIVYPTTNAMGLVRLFSSSYKAMYTRGYFYLNNQGQTTGQIKIYRYVGNTTIPKDGDSSTNANGKGPGGNSVHEDWRLPNVLLHDYWGGPGSYISYNCTGQDGVETSFASNSLIQFNKWVLIETVFKPDTTASAGNGSIQIRTTDASDGTVYGNETKSSRTFWSGSDEAFQWLVIQIYIGNELQVTNAAMYVDPEHYASINTAASTTPKFLLMGDASTYSACEKHKMSIQQFISWSDTTIAFPVNKARQASLTGRYMYAMSGIDTPINSSGIIPVAA